MGRRQHPAGKGDKRRPENTDKYHEGWERVFGKDKNKQTTEVPNEGTNNKQETKGVSP